MINFKNQELSKNKTLNRFWWNVGTYGLLGIIAIIMLFPLLLAYQYRIEVSNREYLSISTPAIA
jgi:hypothetical protein